MEIRFGKTVLTALLVSTLVSGCGKMTLDEKVHSGQVLLRDNDLRGAEVAFKSALAESPSLTSARIGLARVALRKADYATALNALEKGRQGADDTQRRLIKQMQGYTYSFTDDANVMKMDHESIPMLMYYQYLGHLKAHDTERAGELYDQIQEQEGGFAELAGIARSFYETRDAEGVEKLLMRAMQVDATVSASASQSNDEILSGSLEDARLNIVAQLASVKGDAVILADTMKRYHERHPHNARLRMQYAESLVIAKRYDEAETVMAPLVSRYPENGGVNRMMAIIYFEQKQFDKVDLPAVLAESALPGDPLPRLLLAYTALAQNEPMKAREYLALVIDKVPLSHPAQKLYLRLNAMGGDIADAADRSLLLETLDSRDVDLLTSLGGALLKQGDTDRAYALAERAAAQNPAGEPAARLGVLQMSLGDDRALSTLENAFKEAPDSLLAGQSYAIGLLKKRRYNDALTLARQWQKEGQAQDGLLLEAVVLSAQGLNDEALAGYQAAYEHSPDDVRVKAGYLNALVLAGEDDLAEQVFRESIATGEEQVYRFYVSAYRNRDGAEGVSYAANELASILEGAKQPSSDLMLLLAQSYFIVAQYDDAYGWLMKQQESARAPAYFLMKSLIERQRQDTELARKTLNAWQEMEPVNPMPLMAKTRINLEEGQLENALADIDAFIAQAGNDTPATLLRGHILAMMQQWEEMHRVYTSLNTRQKETPLAQALLGAYKVTIQAYSQARSALEPLMSSTPDNVYLPLYVTALKKTGGVDEAVIYLDTLVQRQPDNRYAQFLLANDLAAQQKYQESAAIFDMICDDNATSVVLNNYAYVKLKLNDVAHAKTLSERAVSMSPDTPEFVDTLASVYLSMDQKEKAHALMASMIERGVGVNDSFMETFKKTHPE